MNHNFYSQVIDSKSKIKSKIKQLFSNSFSRKEIIPLWYLLLKAKKPNIDFLAFYDQEKFIGLAYLIKHKEVIYVLYLAIEPEERSKGYGSKVLDLLKSLNNDSKIFLTIDGINLDAKDYKKRCQRKKFYKDNDFIDAKLLLKIGKNTLETMAYKCDVSTQLYKNIFKYLMPSFILKFLIFTRIWKLEKI